MQAYSLEKQNESNFDITGDLTFLSLNKSKQSFDFLKSSKKLTFDLAKVNSADSAGLALMIELIKQSKLYQTEIIFKNIPQQLLTLAKLSGFENNKYFSQFY